MTNDLGITRRPAFGRSGACPRSTADLVQTRFCRGLRATGILNLFRAELADGARLNARPTPNFLRLRSRSAPSAGQPWRQVGFPKITILAERLQVLNNSKSSLRPRDNVVQLKGEAQICCRTAPANDTSKVVSLHNLKAQTKRRHTTTVYNNRFLGSRDRLFRLASRLRRRFVGLHLCSANLRSVTCLPTCVAQRLPIRTKGMNRLHPASESVLKGSAGNNTISIHVLIGRLTPILFPQTLHLREEFFIKVSPSVAMTKTDTFHSRLPTTKMPLKCSD